MSADLITSPKPPVVKTEAVIYVFSLFVPKKVRCISLSYFVATGCTYNLLSFTVFDRLSAQEQQQMTQEKTMAATVDGSGLRIYGSFHLERWLPTRCCHPEKSIFELERLLRSL